MRSVHNGEYGFDVGVIITETGFECTPAYVYASDSSPLRTSLDVECFAQESMIQLSSHTAEVLNFPSSKKKKKSLRKRLTKKAPKRPAFGYCAPLLTKPLLHDNIATREVEEDSPPPHTQSRVREPCVDDHQSSEHCHRYSLTSNQSRLPNIESS